jgi:Domain of unknown function (DUF4258)
MNKKYSSWIVLAVLLVAFLAVKYYKTRNQNNPTVTNNDRNKNNKDPNKNNPQPSNPQDDKGLDRNATDLFFTKHARCRMQCRHITQEEIKEILQQGEINYRKSDLNAAQGPKYAVEGYSHEKQHIRCIFAPNTQHMTVVTVIDLDEDWECPSCK